MKQLKLFTLIALAFIALPLCAQVEEETDVETGDGYYGTNEDYVDFTSDQKKFDDWTIGVYAGIPMIQGADLNTFSDGEFAGMGYDFQAVVLKQLTHAFALGAQFNFGKTKQQAEYSGTTLEGNTDYWTINAIGDLNMSQLLRRVDNKSRFGWAFHVYGGIGMLQYKAEVNDIETTDIGYTASMFINAGAGLRYKLNNNFDVELKGLYYFTGDEEFDGSRSSGAIADIEEGKDDGLFTFNLGLLWKVGKHHEHLSWADPLADIYPGVTMDEVQEKLVVCAQGDKDDDGVCDDWDRELDTPAGARVDGAGRALDTDLDGIIDLNDECVTLPGTAAKNGCPETTEGAAEKALTLTISNLDFSLDSDVIAPSYYPLLDNAANYLKYYSDKNFKVIGHTDTRASKEYNMDLSRRRAENVKAFLVEKHGIPASQLEVVAMGEDDLRFPECQNATTCPEWKNHANRRVVFVEK